MSYLVDDIARILASPISRRQALWRVGGVLAMGVLSSLGLEEASAQTVCGGKTCKSTQYCCTPQGGFPSFCVTNGKTCCGTQKCNAAQKCCNQSSPPFCYTPGKKTCPATKK